MRLDKDESYQRGLREWQVKMTALEEAYEPEEEVKEEPWLDGGPVAGYDSDEEAYYELPSLTAPARLALTAFRHLDPQVAVHGSQALGLADAASDLDLLASIALRQLLNQVRGDEAWQLLEHVPCARVPRVLLRHVPTGQLVDVVEAKADPLAREKDDWLRRKLEQPEAAFWGHLEPPELDSSGDSRVFPMFFHGFLDSLGTFYGFSRVFM